MNKAFAAVAWLVVSFPLNAGVSSPAPVTRIEQQLEQKIDRMTPDQRIGQLLLVGFEGRHLNSALREMVMRWGVGGVVFYRSNITSPSQARELIRQIEHLRPDNAPFMAIDHEGGVVLRFSTDDAVSLPPAMSLGAAGSRDLAFRAGRDVGLRLRALGFTMNFAPVLDVYSNPDSAIGTRAFSDDPAVVGRIGAAFIQGQSDAGVISVAKHFLGEGSAAGDTHDSTPRTAASAAKLESVDLVPFRMAIAADLPAIMTSHVAAPQLTYDALRPVTLSNEAITGLLREKLGFSGLIITDALEMRALTQYHDLGELAIRAIEAGADMVLTAGTTAEQQLIFDRLQEAYRRGRLTDARVRQSLRRILMTKSRWQIKASAEWDRAASRHLIGEIARNSIAVAQQSDGTLPLAAEAIRRRNVLCVGPESFCKQWEVPRCALPSRIASEAAHKIADRCITQSAGPHWIIAGMQNRSQAAMIAEIRNPRLIAVSLGNPHDLELIRHAAAYVAAYGTAPAIESEVAKILTGVLSAHGSLPVKLSLEQPQKRYSASQ